MTFDVNVANALTLALINLNTTLMVREEERKVINYPTFSEQGDKDIDDFIIKLKKAFIINRVSDNKKHLVATSYLRGITANFYDELAGIIRWNVIR